MTIGIDASRAFLPNRTGIEEYSYQVIKALRTELAEERVVLYMRKRPVGGVLRSGAPGAIDYPLPETWDVRELWGPRLWTQGALAREMFRHPPDVLFVPAHTVPWIHPKNTLVTVHGLEYEVCPQAYSRWERWYMRQSIRNSSRWASRIIAVSENTKRDVCRLYSVPAENVTVIYEGVSRDEPARFSECSDQGTEFRRKLCGETAISTPYFLFVGRIETRKNVSRIIEAFDLFKSRHGTEHRLVLAGKPGYGYERIRDALHRVPSRADVRELGYVSHEEKAMLLRNAAAFLFPSLSEGFGLPVLEAQALGIPVLTSSVSSLPEIAGDDAAFFANPKSVEEITRGMEEIAFRSDFRSAIIESGFRNVARFSWEKCAREVAGLLRGI